MILLYISLFYTVLLLKVSANSNDRPIQFVQFTVIQFVFIEMVTVSELINTGNEVQIIFRGMVLGKQIKVCWQNYKSLLSSETKLRGSLAPLGRHILPEILQPNFDFVIDPKRFWPTRLVLRVQSLICMWNCPSFPVTFFFIET